jgi:hypothetical protein
MADDRALAKIGFALLFVGVIATGAGATMPDEKTITEEICLSETEYCASDEIIERERVVDNNTKQTTTTIGVGGLLVGGIVTASAYSDT